MTNNQNNQQPQQKRVTFQVPAHVHAQLAKRSEELGMSPNQAARHVVEAFLEDDLQREESRELAELSHLVRRATALVLMNLVDEEKEDIIRFVEKELP